MPRSPLPDELGPSFRVSDALEAGVGESRLRGADLTRPFHGARARAAHIDENLAWWEREEAEVRHQIAAYRPVFPAGAFFVGPTAALLHGMPLPSGAHDDLHVAVPFPRTAPHRSGIRGVQVLPRMFRLEEIDGLSVTDAPTTWAMLGRTLGRNDLVAVADHLLRVPRHPGGFRAPERPPVAVRADLESALAAGRRLGAAKLREALDLSCTGSSSRAESWMRLALHDAGLPEPVLDFDVLGDRGEFLGCSELAYPKERVAVEYESDRHLERPQLERDIDKYTAYNAAGWTVVRLTSYHVFAVPAEAVRRVRTALIRSSR